PRVGLSRTHVFCVAGAVSVTGWGHGGGRYSQRLRVGSSRSERRLIETLLLGCGLVSRSGLCCGRPRALLLRRAITLLRGGLCIPGLTLRRRLCRPRLTLRRDAERINSNLDPLPLLPILLILAGSLPPDHDER